MKNKSIPLILFIIIALFVFFEKTADAEKENIFPVDPAGYQFSGPSNLVSLDDGLSMAVINRLSQKISKIKHGQIVMEKSVEDFEPFAMLAVDGQIFVSSKKSGEVKILSQVDLSIIKTISVSKSAAYMALSSDRKKIYVACPVRSGNTITIIDIASKSISSSPIYAFNLNMVNKLAANRGKLFASSLSDSISVFNENTSINEGDYNFGFIPDDMVLTDNYLYLSSKEEHKITVVNLKSLEKEKDIPFIGSSPGKMVYDGNKYIYVLNNDRTGKVFKLDITTNEFDDSSCFESGECFFTGPNPEDGVISRDGEVLYVSNYGDNSVTYHFISGKIFVDPRTITVKPLDTDNPDITNSITLKAGGGSGNYTWSAPYGQLSALSGKEVIFTPPLGEDIYDVKVTDDLSPFEAHAKIIVVDIRVTPEDITVADTNPRIFNITGGTPPYKISALQGGVISYTYGESNFTFTPPEKDGVYIIEISDKNNSKQLTTVKLESENVPPLPADASRAAIIVVGGPPNVRINGYWNEFKFSAEKIYRVLKEEKGFADEEIYLLSPLPIDADGNGYPDESIITRSKEKYIEENNIKSAFEWAGQLKKLDQPLFVFLLGHGKPDKFYLNLKEPTLTIEADTLDQYLDEYQKVSGKEVVLLIDSCHSGSFINNLAKEGRAVITSTGEENSAFYEIKDNITLNSFSSYFTDGISHGANLFYSYREACDSLKKFYLNSICKSGIYRFQNPQYEDNGDEKYYDYLMNLETEDGSMLKNIYIRNPKNYVKKTAENKYDSSEKRFANYRESNLSEISTIPGATLSVVSMNSKAVNTISTGNNIELKAKVGVAQGDVKSVYGVIKPSGMKIEIDENGISYLSYPQVGLTKSEVFNLESSNSQIWKSEWKDAVYSGCYEINFYAQLSNGSIAFSDSIEVSVDPPAPAPPESPSIDIIFNNKQKRDLVKNKSSNKYFKGDRLTISFIEQLNWGYDLYAALKMPDGTTMFTLSDINQFFAFTGSEDSVVKWEGKRSQNEEQIILDFVIPKDIPFGKYKIYALMAPQNKNIFDTLNYCIVEESEFDIFDSH